MAAAGGGMNHRRDLGVAIVGAGRIGALRARLAAAHPAVRFVAIADVDAARARELAHKVGAAFHSGDNLQAISRPEVDAVIVATSEGEHTEPVLQALERGKAVLVEKPIALDLAGADRILAEAARRGAAQTCASATAAATRSATSSPRSRCCRGASAGSWVRRRAYSTRARKLSPCSGAIRRRPRSWTH
jgi:predicted dinucleotide-utilizing enzyme